MLGITDPVPALVEEQVERPPAQPSALEHVQQLLGIETESERVAREAETFHLDAGDVRQQAGIARGEGMVKSVEYHLLEQSNTVDATKRMSALRDVIAQAQQVVEAYREHTGRDPAPILTREQHDYLQEHQDVIRDRGEREEFRE